jgi:hypothetical protein
MKDLNTLDQYRDRTAERLLYGCTGDGGNGVFVVRIKGKHYMVIASNGSGWEHVSVSPHCNANHTPSWDVMSAVKDMFFNPEECVVQYHPPKSDYVNLHPNCLHLWRPTEQELPKPPISFV